LERVDACKALPHAACGEHVRFHRFFVRTYGRLYGIFPEGLQVVAARAFSALAEWMKQIDFMAKIN